LPKCKHTINIKQAPSASRAAEQTQRSSSFPRPIHSHGHRCTCLTR